MIVKMERVRRNLCCMLENTGRHAFSPLAAEMVLHSLIRNMIDGGGASGALMVEKLKIVIPKYGTVCIKPGESTKRLLKRLDRLENLLYNTLQDYKKELETLLQPCKEALFANELIKHSELDVRVSVVACIGQILRILAPDDPYGEDQLKEYFQIAISAFERLSSMSGQVYSKAVSILDTMSYSRSCVRMLDLELYPSVDLMFHLFLDGIRASHPKEVFSNMENIMTIIIRNNVDNDEFLFVLLKIIFHRLRRENQNVSPVSFQLAEKTFKNCSGDLKTYLPEVATCLDVPIEDYAEVVVSFFKDATQRENTEPQDTAGDISCSREPLVAIETDLCNLMQGNKTQHPKSDDNCNENRVMISDCFDDPDKLGKSVHVPQEQKPEDTVGNISCPRVAAGLAIETDLCNLMEGYEIQHPKSDDNYNENRVMISDCFDDPDKLGESVHVSQEQKPEETLGDISCPRVETDLCNLMEGKETQNARTENRVMISDCLDGPDKLGKSAHVPQEQKAEEMHVQRKRHRRPNSLKKADEGYDPFWMLVDWKSLEKSRKNIKKNINCPEKTKISKELSLEPTDKYTSASIYPKPSKMMKDSERNEGVSTNTALEPNSEGKIIVSDDDQSSDIIVKNHSEKGQGSSTKLDSVKKRWGKIFVSDDIKEDIVNHSEKGQGSLTKLASVKKSRGKAIVSEDLKKDVMDHYEKGQGSSTKLVFVRKSRGKTIVSEDLKEDVLDHSEKGQGSKTELVSVRKTKGKTIVSEDLNEYVMNHSAKGKGSSIEVALVKKSEGKTVDSEDLKEEIVIHSEKGQGSLTDVPSLKKSRGKTVVFENLKEDIVNHSEKMQWSSVKKRSRGKSIVSEVLKEDVMTSASQCRPTSSKAKALSGKVSKQNPNRSTPRLGKRTRTASGSVGEEVVGCRIKVWWKHDQKFYKGKIIAFDPKYKIHQVNYDDGEIEVLDLSSECWMMLPDVNLAAHDQESA